MLEKISETVQIILFIFFVPFALVILLPYTRIRRMIKKRLGLRPSVLWGPVPILNNRYNAKAVALYGYRSHSFTYKSYHIAQKGFFDYNWESLVRTKVLIPFLPFFAMIWAGFCYDLYQCYFDGLFLYYNRYLVKAEVLLWHVIGKVIVVCAYGADVRTEKVTRGLGKFHVYTDIPPEELHKTHVTDDVIERRTRWVSRFADATVSMGDMIEYTPGSYNDLFYWAIDTAEWPFIPPTDDEKVVVVHAPNHPLYKGTSYLLAAIKKLQAEGLPVELDFVTKMTNAEARKHYERADIIAEQFIGGWHGFFAVESMALGKPVICYIRKRSYLPITPECPIVSANPDQLYDTLKRLVMDKALRQQIGKAGRFYVEKVFSLQAVGKRFDALYQTLWFGKEKQLSTHVTPHAG